MRITLDKDNRVFLGNRDITKYVQSISVERTPFGPANINLTIIPDELFFGETSVDMNVHIVDFPFAHIPERIRQEYDVIAWDEEGGASPIDDIMDMVQRRGRMSYPMYELDLQDRDD